jgi:hypothetical protein
MRLQPTGTCPIAAIAVALFAATACGVVGPSCMDESGPVARADGPLAAGAIATHDIVSPKNSNLVIRLTWPDAAATLALRATITSCGLHTGCSRDTLTPSFGPGGPSPEPQPWPAGLREMVVDGTRGKAYRVEVAGDPVRATTYLLDVTYRIACES